MFSPRIYEGIRSEIWLKIDQSYWFNKLMYNYFIRIGIKAAGFRMTGADPCRRCSGSTPG